MHNDEYRIIFLLLYQVLLGMSVKSYKKEMEETIFPNLRIPLQYPIAFYTFLLLVVLAPCQVTKLSSSPQEYFMSFLGSSCVCVGLNRCTRLCKAHGDSHEAAAVGVQRETFTLDVCLS